MADNSHEKSEALEAEAVFFAESAKEDSRSAPPTMMEPFLQPHLEGPGDFSQGGAT